MIIPVITGANGTVTEGLKKNLEATPGKHSTDSLQKTAVLGTSHIIRKVLQCETGSLSGGDNRWFRRSARKKRTVTGDDMTMMMMMMMMMMMLTSNEKRNLRKKSYTFILSDGNKESEVCRTCSMHGRDQRLVQISERRQHMRYPEIAEAD
jgi:hypothetical protein